MKINGGKISQIIKHFCESNAEFARNVGETPQNINNWVTRGAGMNVLEKILEKYPEVNLNWLLKDEGEMLSVREVVKVIEKPSENADMILALKERIKTLEYQLNNKKSFAKVVVEFDVESDEFLKMDIKDKVVQVLTK